MLLICRYKDISIKGSKAILTNSLTMETADLLRGIPSIKYLADMCGVSACETAFNTVALQELKNTNTTYDLVITELFMSECMLGWAWYFGAQSVVMTSSANLPWAADRFGLPDNPSYIPHYFVEFQEGMSFYERAINAWTLLGAKLMYYWHSTVSSTRLARDFFGDDLPDLDVLAHNTSLQLVNTHFSIHGARPLVPNVIEVAGLHIQEPQPLEKHFDEILTTVKKGVIYFSMGSLISTESMPVATIQALFDAFAELPYKILWKGDKTKLPPGLNCPSNIEFIKWMPQQDMICDPRVVLLITHGGMMGTQEAIYCGVPVLGIPLFADQTLNIRRAEALGYAIMVPYLKITKENILSATKKLLYDPKYTKTAKQFSEEFRDRPWSALETAVYWIEYVMRHRGAPRLQSHAKFLSWYQYYLIDVLLVTVVAPIILVAMIFKRIRSTSAKSTKATKLKVKSK